jgi:triphosphoribosyl-dephospho-CoA synthase
MTISAIRSEPLVEGLNVAELAAEAMYREVILTPKPGLVDRHNNGSHTDMNMKLFMSSIAAIAPWFALFVSKGMQTARQEPGQTLRAIRPIGLACEQAMFRATGASTPIKGDLFAWSALFCRRASARQRRSDRSQRALP